MGLKSFQYLILCAGLIFLVLAAIHEPQTSAIHNTTTSQRDSQTVLRVVHVDNILKALRDSGFKIMASIVERDLSDYFPGIDKDKNNTYTVTLSSNKDKIILFAPADAAALYGRKRPHNRISYRYRIVPMRLLDEEEEEEEEDSDLSDCFYHFLQGSRVQLRKGYRREVEIIHRNIYKDDSVVVHGVRDFLAVYKGFCMLTRIHAAAD